MSPFGIVFSGACQLFCGFIDNLCGAAFVLKVFGPKDFIVFDSFESSFHLQGSAKEWSLGCVIPASWSPLSAGVRFTQPRDHSLDDP